MTNVIKATKLSRGILYWSHSIPIAIFANDSHILYVDNSYETRIQHEVLAIVKKKHNIMRLVETDKLLQLIPQFD